MSFGIDSVGLHIQIEMINQEEEIEDRRRRSRYLRIERQQLRSMDIFRLSDVEFWHQFRVNKTTFHVILDELVPHLNKTLRIDGISAESKIIATIRALAQGSHQKSVGNEMFVAMSQPSVSRSIGQVIQCIIEHLSDKYVAFPTTEQQRNCIKDWFRTNYKIPNVIGYIDTTQIGIFPPSTVNAQYPENLYVNRKQVHAINTQIIVDHECRILSLNAKFPGSIHDSHIWRLSGIRKYLSEVYADNHEWLLGDSSYPLEPWLLTPIDNVQNDNERRFNDLLVKAHCTVERAIGLLKGRWRCLCKQRMLHYKPETCSNIINACAILHNICINNDDYLPDVDAELEQNEGNVKVVIRRKDEALRNVGNENRNEVITYIIENP